MEKAQCVELLQALNSTSKADRQKAETLYQQGAKDEPEKVLLGVTQVVGSADVDEGVRRQGAVLLRQLCNSARKEYAFEKIAAQAQPTLANELLRIYSAEPNHKLQKQIGEVVDRLAMSVAMEGGARVEGMPNGWPELVPAVFHLAHPATAASAESCENAIFLLMELANTLTQVVFAQQQQLSQVIESALGHASVKIRAGAVRLVCGVVVASENDEWKQLTVTVPVMVQVVKQLVAAQDTTTLVEVMQALVDAVEDTPDFFKQALQQPATELATTMAEIARSRQIGEGNVRVMASEWLVSFAEKKEKFIKNNLSTYPALVVEVAMSLLLELEDGEEELKEWMAHMEDEGDEDEEDEVFEAGEDALDRIASALPIEMVLTAMQAVIAQLEARGDWQAKNAVLVSIRQVVEYVEDRGHVDAMSNLVLKYVNDPHPRVRYEAFKTIGQMSKDQAPHYQEASYRTIMPIFLATMDDPVHRVAAMSMSAFVIYGEDLDDSLMSDFSRAFMEKLATKLAVPHRHVQEEAITSIAVIAGVIEKDFSDYYATIMPMLKEFVLRATGEKENKLRGKAFECMSLLGVAVGKERFLPDALDALNAMMSTNVESDDLQREYISEASERICGVLKKDFAPYLPGILPGLFKKLKLEDDTSAPENAGLDTDDPDNEYLRVCTGDGKFIRVKTSRFEELEQATSMLQRICLELEGAVYDYVPAIAEAVLPLLSTDEIASLTEDARTSALGVWALLIKARRLGAQERGVADQVPVELLRTGMARVLKCIDESEDDAENLAAFASGIGSCVQNVGPGVLGAAEMLQLADKAVKLIEASMARSQAEQAGSKQDEDGESDDESVDEEFTCRQATVDVLSSLMQVGPTEFSSTCLPPVSQKMREWLAAPAHRPLGLMLGCSMVEHLRESSEPVWQVLFADVFAVLDGLSQPSVPLVTASIYASWAINLAASLPNFAMAAPDAFRKVAVVVGSFKPKKRDTKGKLALENAVAALVSLAKDQAAQCPPDIQPWTLVLAHLPLKADDDEAKKVHEKVVDLLMAQNEALLGGPQRANLPRLLGVLAEIYKDDDTSTEATDAKIQQVFTMLSAEMLASCAAEFSEKQQKKIQKMRTQSA